MRSALFLRRAFCSAPPPPPLPFRQRFVAGCKRHAPKVIWLYGAILAAVLYPQIKKTFVEANNKAKKELKENLEQSRGTIQVVEAYLIRVILDVLASPEVVNKGVDFTTDVLNDPKMNEELLKFLIAGLKNPVFLEEVKKLGINLTVDILKDPEVQRDLTKLLIVSLNLLAESVSRP